MERENEHSIIDLPCTIRDPARFFYTLLADTFGVAASDVYKRQGRNLSGPRRDDRSDIDAVSKNEKSVSGADRGRAGSVPSDFSFRQRNGRDLQPVCVSDALPVSHAELRIVSFLSDWSRSSGCVHCEGGPLRGAGSAPDPARGKWI